MDIVCGNAVIYKINCILMERVVYCRLTVNLDCKYRLGLDAQTHLVCNLGNRNIIDNNILLTDLHSMLGNGCPVTTMSWIINRNVASTLIIKMVLRSSRS